MTRSTTTPGAAAGVGYALGAYLIWGFLPVFLKALGSVPAPEVLAHRVLWSLLLLAIVAIAMRRWPQVLAVLRSPRALGALVVTALLIAANWFLYIWAVNSGRVLETSLGYFINPLLNVSLGVLVLGERLRRAQGAAVGLAAVGVLILAFTQGQLPWIAFALAGSFGLYGLFRKMAPVDPLTGLLVETALLAPLALLYLRDLHGGASGSFGGDVGVSALLVLSGAVTAVPLLMFAAAGKRLPYATIGLLQYIAPTIQFLLAVFLYVEPMTEAHVATFVCIWAGLALYATDSVVAARRVRPA